MYKRSTMVVNKTGLHARPASDFVAEAKKYKSRITITNLTDYPDEPGDAKSIIEILSGHGAGDYGGVVRRGRG